MRTLLIAAAALLIAGAAHAQSAISNPSQPGSGFQSPAATGPAHGQTSGIAPRGADPAHPQPGEGYKAPTGNSPTAPAEPTDSSGKYKGKKSN